MHNGVEIMKRILDCKLQILVKNTFSNVNEKFANLFALSRKLSILEFTIIEIPPNSITLII